MVKRLTKEEALDLFKNADLLSLGERANALRWELNPNPVVSFVIDRNINYTNICVSGCLFCAFSRPPGHPEVMF